MRVLPRGRKVKKRTLANIFNWATEVIAGLRVLFKGGHASDIPLEDQFEILRSLPHAHVAAVLDTLRGIGLHQKLERKSSESRALAIALIAGCILFPGPKLALSRHLSLATATSTPGEETGALRRRGARRSAPRQPCGQKPGARKRATPRPHLGPRIHLTRSAGSKKTTDAKKIMAKRY